MAMVLKATITLPWDGRNFGALDEMRKILAETRDKIEAVVGKGKLQYDESLSNVREKLATVEPVEPRAGLL